MRLALAAIFLAAIFLAACSASSPGGRAALDAGRDTAPDAPPADAPTPAQWAMCPPLQAGSGVRCEPLSVSRMASARPDWACDGSDADGLALSLEECVRLTLGPTDRARFAWVMRCPLGGWPDACPGSGLRCANATRVYDQAQITYVIGLAILSGTCPQR